MRDFYFFYEVIATGEVKKLGRARFPGELEDKFNVYERMTTKNKK